jgi:hypothetical protein
MISPHNVLAFVLMACLAYNAIAAPTGRQHTNGQDINNQHSQAVAILQEHIEHSPVCFLTPFLCT